MMGGAEEVGQERREGFEPKKRQGNGKAVSQASNMYGMCKSQWKQMKKVKLKGIYEHTSVCGDALPGFRRATVARITDKVVATRREICSRVIGGRSVRYPIDKEPAQRACHCPRCLLCKSPPPYGNAVGKHARIPQGLI